jgi:hypothetical protein
MLYPELQPQRERNANPGSLIQQRGPGGVSRRLPGRSGELIGERLSQLGVVLSRPDASIDSREIEGMLLLLSADIRSGCSELASSDYRRIIERLTEIYAQGFGQRAGDVFTTTADSYAQLIETISRAYPVYDYSEAVGQLFCYMSRLFRTGKNGWKAVYEHLLSIPDSVEAKQVLNRAFFVEIQEWAEAGVENLFSIRKDLYEKIGNIEVKIEGLGRRIEKIAGPRQLSDQASAAPAGSNIVDLAQARRNRLVESLRLRRRRLMEEKQNEETIVGLIESDIHEFEKKLRATRRAYFIHAV